MLRILSLTECFFISQSYFFYLTELTEPTELTEFYASRILPLKTHVNAGWLVRALP